MSVQLRPLRTEEFAAWDEEVFSCKEGTVFHTSEWLNAGRVPFEIMGIFRDSRLAGGFVAQFKAAGGSRRESARSALTPYSGQVVFERSGKRSSDVTTAKEVAAESAEYLQQNLDRVNVRLSPFVVDLQPYLWKGFSARVRYTYLLDLSEIDATWNGLDENHRRSIKKAERLGLSTRFDLRVRDFAEVFRATREQPEVWGQQLHSYEEALGREGRCRTFGTFDANGTLLAAHFIVWDRNRSYYLLGGYREDGGAPAEARIAGTYGLWRAIRFTREELGLREFDLEGSMIPGVELFFRKFGGVLTPFYTIAWQRGNASAAARVKRRIGALISRNKETR